MIRVYWFCERYFLLKNVLLKDVSQKNEEQSGCKWEARIVRYLVKWVSCFSGVARSHKHYLPDL
jgi:hypothetical protein